MRKVLLLFVLSLTSCAALQEMNQNMQQASELMEENTQTMISAKETISQNTQEVKKSTEGMKEFRITFPILLAVLVAILLIPAFILFKLYRKLLTEIKLLIEEMKKKH